MTPSKEREDTTERVGLRKMILVLNKLSLRQEFGELLGRHIGAWRVGYA